MCSGHGERESKKTNFWSMKSPVKIHLLIIYLKLYVIVNPLNLREIMYVLRIYSILQIF